jgi:hypothetical protein
MYVPNRERYIRRSQIEIASHDHHSYEPRGLMILTCVNCQVVLHHDNDNVARHDIMFVYKGGEEHVVRH